MLELQLALFVEFPEKMNPGIFVVASDILTLFNSEGDLSFTKPGFTALAHPSPINIGTTHGVFALSDDQASEVITLSNRFLYKSTSVISRMPFSDWLCYSLSVLL